MEQVPTSSAMAESAILEFPLLGEVSRELRTQDLIQVQ